jgi:hypothetical protein
LYVFLVSPTRHTLRILKHPRKFSFKAVCFLWGYNKHLLQARSLYYDVI